VFDAFGDGFGQQGTATSFMVTRVRVGNVMLFTA
jgi:hypothetical protein